jgi:hypothetical protein
MATPNEPCPTFERDIREYIKVKSLTAECEEQHAECLAWQVLKSLCIAATFAPGAEHVGREVLAEKHMQKSKVDLTSAIVLGVPTTEKQ